MRTARRGSIPITWSPPVERHQGLVELARRRSDLFNPSSMSRPAGKLVSDSTKSSGALRLDAQVVGIEGLTPRHHRPQDARVLVGQRNHRLLPTGAFAQRQRPLRDPVLSSVRRHHGRLRPLDQQRAQVGVAALGDAAQAGLAAAGVLARRQADPRAELSAVPELPEVVHGGDHGYTARTRGDNSGIKGWREAAAQYDEDHWFNGTDWDGSLIHLEQ